MFFSLLLFGLGNFLYAHNDQHWFVYIGKSYQIPADIAGFDKHRLFVVMAVTGMIFSPIGEEFFFRGLVHKSFANTLGNGRAALVDALAFALTHIAHFGLLYVANQWVFLPIPAFIWTGAMFSVSLLFHFCMRYSQSIWAAVLCHAGFNLGMIYTIFYLLHG